MGKIYLVRHATYANPLKILPGRLPVELSEEGIKEAETLRNYFRSKDIEKIYSSAVLRCKQTANIIADEKILVEFDKRLLECFSAMQGFWIHDWKHYWGHKHELGGEYHKDVQDRMVDFFTSTNWDASKNYIICSHGDPLYFLYEHLAGLPLDKDWELDSEIFEAEDYQPKGSVRVVDFLNGKFIVGDLIKNDKL